MGTTRRRRSLASLAAVVAVAAGAVIAAPAHAAPARQPPLLQLLDASRTWVLYAVNEHVYVKPAGGGRSIKINGYSDSNGQQLTGDFLIYTTPHAQVPDQRYLDLRTGAAGKVPGRWQTATPDGGAWTSVAKQDGKIHGYAENAATGMITDYGPLPGLVQGKHVGTGASYSDEHGLVFAQGNDATGRVRADYVAYTQPGHVIRLDLKGVGYYAACSLTGNALGCVNSYLDRDPGLRSDAQVVRIPLDGAAQQKPITVVVPKVSKRAHPYVVPALTSARTAWTFGIDPPDSYFGPTPAFQLHSVSTTQPGGHRTSSQFRIGDPSDLVTGGNRIYVAHDARAGTAGIYRVVDDGKKQKLLVHV